MEFLRVRAARQPEIFRRTPIGHPFRTAEQPSKWMRRTIHITGKIEPFFGTLDENIRLLEDSLQVRTHLHDTRITVEGEQDSVDQAVRIVEEYNHLTRHGRLLSSAEVKSLMRVATEEPNESPRGMFEHGRTRSFGKKTVTPKTAGQKRYMEEIESHDMTFGIGPGGTGKTYLAVAMAVSALLTKQMNRIILARPAVEAGERLGFLPGTLQQKIDPYMRPLYDALYDMLDADKLERFLEKGIIEVAPLAFMRAYGLKVPLSRAEALNLEQGSALVEEAVQGQTLTLANELGLPTKVINLENLRRIMSLRLEEIFQLICQDLEQADALDYLRAGVFLCGGGARIPQIAKLAEQIFQVPLSLGKTNSISGLKSALDQPEFATPIGLVKFGSFQQRKRAAKGSLTEGIKSTFGQFFKRG